MRRRRNVIFAIIIVLLSVIFFEFFYKSIDETRVPAGTDAIIAIDVKRIISSALWNTITHPSQWTFSRRGHEGVDWKDIVVIPDYIFCSHLKGTPYTVWYTVFDLKDADLFQQEMQKIKVLDTFVGSQFEVIQFKQFRCTAIKSGNKLLVATQDDIPAVVTAARQLFNEGRHADPADVKKAIGSHHVSGLLKNFWSPGSVSFGADFNQEGIKLESRINGTFKVSEHTFRFDTSVMVFASVSHFEQLRDLYKNDSTQSRINRFLNFDVDSLFLNSNISYTASLFGLNQRTDTALTYSYDENFEPVEAKVIHEVAEPSFNFSIKGNDVQLIYDFWKSSQLIKEEGGRNFFTAFPLTRTAVVLSEKELTLFSEPPTQVPGSAKKSALAFVHINFTAVSNDMLRMLPGALSEAATKFSSFEMEIKKADHGFSLIASVKKRWPSKALMSW